MATGNPGKGGDFQQDHEEQSQRISAGVQASLGCLDIRNVSSSRSLLGEGRHCSNTKASTANTVFIQTVKNNFK